VLAVERSARFLDSARERCASRGVTNVEFREADLMESSLGKPGLRCGVVPLGSCFVSSPKKLIENIAGALRPGGVAIFHEYSDYPTFRFMPVRPALERFSDEVMASWRAAGGEPNVARELPQLLSEAGLRVTEIVPRVRTVSRRDYTWQWPKSFVGINVARLRELERVSDEWAAEVRREFAAADADPNAWFTTPMFLEIVARKRVRTLLALCFAVVLSSSAAAESLLLKPQRFSTDRKCTAAGPCWSPVTRSRPPARISPHR
jgi:SAM-dependent methyltransferase